MLPAATLRTGLALYESAIAFIYFFNDYYRLSKNKDSSCDT